MKPENFAGARDMDTATFEAGERRKLKKGGDAASPERKGGKGGASGMLGDQDDLHEADYSGAIPSIEDDYHPGAHYGGEWQCCGEKDPAARGCKTGPPRHHPTYCKAAEGEEGEEGEREEGPCLGGHGGGRVAVVSLEEKRWWGGGGKCGVSLSFYKVDLTN